MTPLNHREYRDTPSKWLGTCVEGPYKSGHRRLKGWEKALITAAAILAVSSLFYSKSAAAAEDTDRVSKIGIHLLSDHLDRKPYQNNQNLGLYVETSSGWTGGFYRNTLDRTSLYAGKTFYHPSGFGITLAAVSGYKKITSPISCPDLNRRHKKHEPERNVCEETLGFSPSHWSPMVAPHYTLGPARLWFIPSLGRTSSVLHLSLEYSLK